MDCSPKPTLFVPESQLEALIAEINDSFPHAKLGITPDLREEGLVIDFADINHADLRPRWLGHSTSRAQAEVWPTHIQQHIASKTAMSDKNVKLFKEKMELANEIGRNKKKAAKKAKHAEAVVKRQAMTKELLRAQKYLGLLPAAEESVLPDIANLTISAVDDTKPAPHPFSQEPIFIAFDVEAYERPPKQITEVGIATLDTRDLKDVPPEKYGKTWQGAIRARHFRIAEYKHLINKDFVIGCPQSFEFGTSEFVGMDKIASTVSLPVNFFLKC